VNLDLPDLPEPADPALDGLVRALTANGTADELAGRQAALAMFRKSRRPKRRRFAVRMSTAAAAVVMAGWIAAGYAAALPGPVQHVTYRMLGSIGVPDTHHQAPAPSPSRSISSTHASPPASAVVATPAVGPVPTLALAAARPRILAGGDDVLSGRLVPRGRPEAGARIWLLEHAGGRKGWRVAGTGVTDGNGDVTFTVMHLTGNASFRLVGPDGAASTQVPVTVLVPVSLSMAPGQAGLETLTARAPYADPGDAVVLQELSGGVWYRVGTRALGRDHLASFTVLIPASAGVEYRVILPGTARHGSSVSGRVRVTAPVRTAARVRASSRTTRQALR
jgi:hypothetical protein